MFGLNAPLTQIIEQKLTTSYLRPNHRAVVGKFRPLEIERNLDTRQSCIIDNTFPVQFDRLDRRVDPLPPVKSI